MPDTPERPIWVRFTIPILLLLGLACGPCSLLSRQSPTPPPRVVVSTEAAGNLESRIQQILNSPAGQQFILRMSDAEVTSLLTVQLATLDGAPVSNPMVWFTKGKIYATGRLVNIVPIETDFSLTASAHVQDGKLSVTIEQISAGDVPLPTGALGIISQSINQTVDELQLDIQVSALEILEGEAIVKGTRK